jgi:uncharacterized membrane protein
VDIQTWHPLTVHFPIAFLMLSGFLSLYLIFKFQKSLAFFNLGLLVLGLIGCGISIYTGNIEDGKVSRDLCDPTILKDHENFAYYLLYIFLANLLLWVIRLFVFPKSFKLILSAFILLSSVMGSSCLVYVGHLGASLVYEQAAGVDVPGEDCEGF